MPTYKLTYFDFKGLGEPIRMLLTYMGREFEEERIQLADWLKIKDTIPYKKVPVLEVDGKPLYQSHAICRYLGREANLYGDDAWEAAQIDMVAGTIMDMHALYIPLWTYTDPEEKEAFIKRVRDEHLTYYMNLWNENANKGENYLANGKLSWIDFYFNGWFETLSFLLKAQHLLDDYPHLKAGQEKFRNLPRVKEWIAKRPETM